MRSVTGIAPAGTRAAIRLRPVPRYEPPFDDEVAPQVVWSSAQQLALDWARPVGPPARIEPEEMRAPGRRRGSVVGHGVGERDPGGPDAAGAGSHRLVARPGPAGGGADISGESQHASPVVAGASGDAKLAVKRFVRMCVEVLNGHRPAAHLRRLALPSEAAEIVAQGLAGARRVADMRRPRRPGDRRGQRISPVAVLKVHLCEPRVGAVEVAVALVTGERTWAMALRLELHQETWSATALRLI